MIHLPMCAVSMLNECVPSPQLNPPPFHPKTTDGKAHTTHQQEREKEGATRYFPKRNVDPEIAAESGLPALTPLQISLVPHKNKKYVR